MNYKSFNLGDWIGHISGVIEDESELDGNEMRDLVEFLTTLIQEPKTGHWIRWYETIEQEHCTIHDPHCKCSECNQEYDPYIASLFNYCPNCGARMIEPQESEEI